MSRVRPLSRRVFLLSGAASFTSASAAEPVVDTHIHFFDPARFAYHKQAVYSPPPATLDGYAAFVRDAGIDHTIVVHPEPYQDDHSYLEYCFANEPSNQFFKGTCLYDPTDPGTPARMEALTKKNPGRIVALRIHVNRKKGEAPTPSGPIPDRDLRHPQMKSTWRKAHELGLAIQMHIIPCHAPQIHELASDFRQMPVIIDHLARSSFGTPAEYAQVLELARLPNVIMKFSGVRYSASEEYPFRDVRALVRQTYDAFGPDRMIWGGLGRSVAEFKQNKAVFDEMFAFAPEADRLKIRGQNAMRLFWS